MVYSYGYRSHILKFPCIFETILFSKLYRYWFIFVWKVHLFKSNYSFLNNMQISNTSFHISKYRFIFFLKNPDWNFLFYPDLLTTAIINVVLEHSCGDIYRHAFWTVTIFVKAVFYRPWITAVRLYFKPRFWGFYVLFKQFKLGKTFLLIQMIIYETFRYFQWNMQRQNNGK